MTKVLKQAFAVAFVLFVLVIAGLDGMKAQSPAPFPCGEGNNIECELTCECKNWRHGLCHLWNCEYSYYEGG